MKKETVEKFFKFLDRKERRGLEKLNLQAVIHWGEVERIKDSKDGTLQTLYQVMKKEQEGERSIAIKVNGDLDVDELLDIAEIMLQEESMTGMDLYIAWEKVDRLEVSGNADFSGEFTARLPAITIVGGDLDIRNSFIYSLPTRHLEVGGDFYIGGSSLWKSKYDMNEFRLEADLKEKKYKIGGEISYTDPGPLYSTFTL